MSINQILKKPWNCLVIGLGSAGQRHKLVLEKSGYRVYGVTSSIRNDVDSFPNIKSAFEAQDFNYVVIANKTCDHYESLLGLIRIDYKGLVLIEKPSFDKVRPLPDYDYRNTYVGYNLRFHPIIQRIKSFLKGRRIFSVNIYVGQYLPQWRPGTNYQESYSSSKAQGGGVLRDLSHEIDYVQYLTGKWKRVAAIGGTFGNLQIDSDDVYSMLMETEHCPAIQIQMNYLDQKPRREMIINIEGISLKADFIANTLQRNNDCESFNLFKDYTYQMMHKNFLNGQREKLCTFVEGLEIVQLLETVEEANLLKVWKKR